MVDRLASATSHTTNRAEIEAFKPRKLVNCISSQSSYQAESKNVGEQRSLPPPNILCKPG